MEDVVKRIIWLEEHHDEYLVALPPVLRMSHDPFAPPTKSQLVVLVYRCVGASRELKSNWYRYEFVGVDVR
jgi:hypothetical protein